MHFACNQLLARTRLAGDEDRDVGAGDPLDFAEDFLDGGRRTEDLAETDALDAVLQRLVVDLQFVDQKRVANHQRGFRGEDGEDF